MHKMLSQNKNFKLKNRVPVTRSHNIVKTCDKVTAGLCMVMDQRVSLVQLASDKHICYLWMCILLSASQCTKAESSNFT
jgi:hypothetical protein